MTCDTWNVTYGRGWTFSKNFSFLSKVVEFKIVESKGCWNQVLLNERVVKSKLVESKYCWMWGSLNQRLLNPRLLNSCFTAGEVAPLSVWLFLLIHPFMNSVQFYYVKVFPFLSILFTVCVHLFNDCSLRVGQAVVWEVEVGSRLLAFILVVDIPSLLIKSKLEDLACFSNVFFSTIVLITFN